MPFWKKSEDPWDIDPDKKKKDPVSVFETETEAEQELESVFAEIKGLFQKKEEPEEDPPACPWCGKTMKRAYILGGRDRLRLSDEKPGVFFGSLGHDPMEFNDDGFLTTHKSCWQCKDCRKVVADIPEPEAEPEKFAWDGNPVAPPAPEEIENEK